MIYKLGMSPSISPILAWLYIFSSLSLSQFSKVRTYLDFPFDPPEDLRLVAHDFTLTWHTMQGFFERETARERLQRNGETTTIDLLEGIPSDFLESASPNMIYRRRIETLFANSFAHLEKMGYAQTVYQWGRHSHDFCVRVDVSTFRYFYHFLSIWAVSEWMKSPAPLEHPLYSSDWSDLFAETKFDGVSDLIKPIPLSTAQCAVLQPIILHQKAQRIRLRATCDQLETSPKSVGDDFAYHAGAAGVWSFLDGDYRIGVQAWRMLSSVLSPDEMGILEQWVAQHRDAQSSFFWMRYLEPLSQQFKDFIAGKEDEA